MDCAIQHVVWVSLNRFPSLNCIHKCCIHLSPPIDGGRAPCETLDIAASWLFNQQPFVSIRESSWRILTVLTLLTNNGSYQMKFASFRSVLLLIGALSPSRMINGINTANLLFTSSQKSCQMVAQFSDAGARCCWMQQQQHQQL